ncbi:hypothetical protein HYX03_00950 [Candidatus Woesearchaeota archaeon]|nr:hypothetical protein [Candidatus Woesearchaeota archaeon]
MKFGMEDAIKSARLHFKVTFGDGNSVKDILNLTDEKINSKKLLKMAIEKRKKNHKEQANVFIFNNPIKSPSAVIKDGEALTYVSEGITIFSFDAFKKYPCNFLRRRAKHEVLHMLGLNTHHEDTKVRGYNNEVPCVMKYNAPVMNACGKCKDALACFWKGIEYATKKQFVKN